jgi:hypothetical protein
VVAAFVNQHVDDVARDDGGSLSEDGIRELTNLLTSKGVLPSWRTWNQESSSFR